MRNVFKRGVVALVVGLFLATGLVAAPASAATGVAAEVFSLVNQNRANAGLPALMSDPTLDRAAQVWAQHLADTNSFEHSTYDWRVSMISSAGWTNSGENIAAGYATASTVMTAWMNSSGHRANILNSSYTGMGVGYVRGGSYGYYWVQIFARSTAPRLTPGAAPVVSGTPEIGSTLTATTSGWPSGTTISWTWQADGAVVSGATSSTYIPSLSDNGRRITAVATGSRSGYLPASTTSAATTVVSGAPPMTRLSGADRYATAVAISKNSFSPGIEVAYVALGTNFPDALGAAPAASVFGAPLLLTPSTSVPASVLNELTRLGPDRIVVVGGAGAISNSVVATLENIAPTTRIAGSNRYETSRAIVTDAFDSADVVYLATGTNFPDALTASAAAGAIGAPVILVDSAASALDAATLQLLVDLGATSVRIAGGTSAVRSSIETQLNNAGYSVLRVSGTDRYETGRAINAQAFDSASTVYMASGTNFPDALAGAALAGGGGAPLFVVRPGCIPESISRGVTDLNPSTIVLLGGTGSLSAAVGTYKRC